MNPMYIKTIVILSIMALAIIGLIVFATKKKLLSEFLLTFFRAILSIGISILILYLWGIFHGNPHPFDQGALIVLGVIYWPLIIVLSISTYNFLGEIKYFKPNGN